MYKLLILKSLNIKYKFEYILKKGVKIKDPKMLLIVSFLYKDGRKLCWNKLESRLFSLTNISYWNYDILNFK